MALVEKYSCCYFLTGLVGSQVHAKEVGTGWPRPGSSTTVDCHAASDSDPPWWCWHRLEDWKLGSLTFPSAPSSTPSSPMISFKLTAPVDCFPPSNFKSLGRTSPRENALVYTPKSHDDVYYTRHHNHTDENEYMGSSQQGIPLTLLGAG